MRDDFKASIKDKLAKRVGYRCSNCEKQTSGPGESNDGVSLIGVAAHICAASEGGPRYDPMMTSEQRSSIDNGIWLCQNCAHLIDTDIERYTVEVLHSMKSKAEEYAHEQIASNDAFPYQRQSLDIDTRNKIISCAKTIKEGGNALAVISGTYRPATLDGSDFDVYEFMCGYIQCLHKFGLYRVTKSSTVEVFGTRQGNF